MEINFLPCSSNKFHAVITIDDEEWKTVHKTIFGRSPSFPKGCNSLEEFAEEFVKMEYRLAKNYAIKRLSLQSLPSAILIKAMKERLISPASIERLIQEFTDLGYINDSQWSTNFVNRQSQKKVGPRAIAQKLAGKGMEQGLIKEALADSWTITKQKKLIKDLMQTRYRKFNLQDYKQKNKVISSLVRRGFDISIILDFLE